MIETENTLFGSLSNGIDSCLGMGKVAKIPNRKSDINETLTKTGVFIESFLYETSIVSKGYLTVKILTCTKHIL